MTKEALKNALSQILQSADAVAALTTIAADGVPTTVIDAEFSVTEKGTLLYREFFEGSRSNRDLLHSLWFNRVVSFAVSDGDTRLHGYGVPTHSHVAGPLFQEHYRATNERDNSADLAAVWEIRIDDLEDVSPQLLRNKQDTQRPFFRHLDRLITPEA